MSINENSKIVFLSGPSSSGKTTSTRGLQERGWMRIEADTERPHVDISFLRLTPAILNRLSYIESHLANPTDVSILETLYGRPPDKVPETLEAFHQARKELLDFLSSKRHEIGAALVLHMLNKAIEVAKQGRSVIIDDVPMINERFYGHHSISLDTKRPNLWVYKDFSIEQQLKYVPIDILMRNLIRRNQNPEDHRDMPRVIEEQYSTRFVACSTTEQEVIGTLKIESLKKWIERAVKIDFFDISPNHAFVYDATMGNIDLAIEQRMKSFVKEMDDPANAIDPKGDKVDAQDIDVLKQRKAQYPELQKLIDEKTQRILKNMLIPQDAIEVNLTYIAPQGVKPTIVKDPAS